MNVPIKVDHPKANSIVGITKDVSEGGVFVQITDPRFAAMDKVSVQACDMDDAPIVHGYVAWATAEGIGVAFDELGEDPEQANEGTSADKTG
jgi:hypothetical protein